MDFWRALAPIWKGVGLSASLTFFYVRVSKRRSDQPVGSTHPGGGGGEAS